MLHTGAILEIPSLWKHQTEAENVYAFEEFWANISDNRQTL